MIRRYVVKNARPLVQLFVLSGASAAASILLLDFLNERAADGMRGEGLSAALAGCLFLLLLVAVKAISAQVAAAFGARLVAELRWDLGERFLKLDIEKLLSRKHAVFGALIEDIGRVAPLIQMSPVLLNNLLLSIVGTVYLFHLSAVLAAVALPFIVLTGLLLVFTERLMHGRFDKMRQADESLFALLRVIVEGKKELTLIPARARHFATVQLRPAIERARTTQYGTASRWGLVDAMGEGLTYSWVLLIVIAGSVWFSQSSTVILQFVIAGLFLSGPIDSLFSLGASVSNGLASLRHLESLGLELDSKPASTPTSTNAAVAGPSGDWQQIRMEGVSYSYPDAAETGYRLGPIDLEISRGETVFISGGNGSGKSTLLLLLCGLVTPAAGSIHVDGKCISPHELHALRQRCSAVFFDFNLFSHVIDASGAAARAVEVAALLSKVQMTGKVEYRDGILSSVDLSQGQRKRLALLQSWLDDRDIMIFDEFTADQDREFRDRFYTQLLPELKLLGKTLIVVTHDERYLGCADRVIAMDCGRIRSETATP